MAAQWNVWKAEWAVISWLLPLALLHGLLYLALVPPWQHYDEPSHFEYAAQIAAGEFEAPGPQAVGISHAIAVSMYRHGFYPPGEHPNIEEARRIRLGYNQRVHPPLYYSVAAVPLGFLQDRSVELQLYGARMVSLVLYALSVLAAWRIAVTLLPDEPLMQLVIPLLLLFTPTFADLMTAVNSDVLVNFAALVLLLGCARLLRDGFQPMGLLLALFGLAVALFTKRTAIPMLVPFGLTLLWAGWRQPLPWRIWLPTGLSLLAGVSIASFRFERVEGALRILPRDWLLEFDRNHLRIYLDRWLLSVADWELSAPIYPEVVRVMFESFWARLAWGHISLGASVDLMARMLTVAVCIGLLVRGWQLRGQLPLWQQRSIWLCFAMVCVAWFVTIMHVHPLPPYGQWLHIPRGRYMFWAILPHLWLLALGWQGLFPQPWRRWATIGLLLLFVGLSSFAWSSVLVDFYYLT
ncbi:hypothetical protein [Candidatus Viridilinea mediisalina]|uniref:Uncharacterized protein n=1 Tax=Candidatus Viridilinea mediisalina TaxID=2024553 RepID=A0A2A6RKY6_9CHLR|nr:hypothetical protein [Candidatus Viridilinea mediisalina]PDW03593.1 hypothetical protein CJ255_07955 [Candidatus Viridilinea mediisalina]